MDAVYLTAVAKVCQQEVSQMTNDEFPMLIAFQSWELGVRSLELGVGSWELGVQRFLVLMFMI
jgi:hypothetical protein